MDDTITLGDVRRWEVKPGDVLVITLDAYLDQEETEAFIRQAREHLPESVTVMLLPPGSSVDILAAS